MSEPTIFGVAGKKTVTATRTEFAWHMGSIEVYVVQMSDNTWVWNAYYVAPAKRGWTATGRRLRIEAGHDVPSVEQAARDVEDALREVTAALVQCLPVGVRP